jgi:hypothetical protein
MPAKLLLSGTIVIVGNYGSGKTEVTINLAVSQKKEGRDVQVADLDLVNPYFRTREARQMLTTLGIRMVLPPVELLQADLPILVPGVAGLIRQPADLALLDVGGDPVGATVLSALADIFNASGRKAGMLQVVNPYRPNTEDVAGCLAMRAAIEQRSRLAVTGWIGNAHLLDETRWEHIQYGYDFMRALAAESGLPLRFVTAPRRLMAQAENEQWDCPVLPIHRQLVPPWLKAQAIA